MKVQIEIFVEENKSNFDNSDPYTWIEQEIKEEDYIKLIKELNYVLSKFKV